MNNTNLSRLVRWPAGLASALILALALGPAAAVAKAPHSDGGFDGGGGDPLVNEFLEVAQKIERAQELHYIQLGVEPFALSVKLHAIRLSLEGKNPLVAFPEGETVSCFGFPKLGCVGADGVIRIAREGWAKSSPRARVEVTAMELVKSLQGIDRYRVASEAADVLGGEGRFDAEELYQAVNAAQKFQPLFDQRCEIPVINSAMRMLGTGDRYPQFDLKRDDDFQNFTSVTFDEQKTNAGRSSDKFTRQFLFVSAIWNSDVASVPMVFPIGGKMVRREGVKGERQMVYVFYKAQEPRYSMNRCVEIERTQYDQATRAEGDYLEAPLTWHSTDEGPKEIKPEWMKQAPFFQPCQRDTLNLALERAALDQSFEKFTGNTFRSYELLSAYRMENLKKPGSYTYFINLNVSTFGFSTPYIFRMTATESEDTCTISDVKMR